MTSKTRSKAPDIVTLADLAPRHPVVGGRERRIFGSADKSEPRAAASRRADRDLPTSKPVKSGRLAGNDNMTLVRAGRARQASFPTQSIRRSVAMAGAKKDLPAKKNVKGGRLGANDSMTLVRGAKPKADLPAKKPVKGGRIGNKNV